MEKPDTGAKAGAAVGNAVATKQDFDLHTLLVMRQDKVAKSKALLAVYREGLAGLATRLAS